MLPNSDFCVQLTKTGPRGPRPAYFRCFPPLTHLMSSNVWWKCYWRTWRPAENKGKNNAKIKPYRKVAMEDQDWTPHTEHLQTLLTSLYIETWTFFQLLYLSLLQISCFSFFFFPISSEYGVCTFKLLQAFIKSFSQNKGKFYLIFCCHISYMKAVCVTTRCF